MIQIDNLEVYTEADIPKLVSKIEPILDKRKKLHEKYSRGASDKQLMYSTGDKDKLITKLPFEKFITDLATGYTAGSPRYTVNTSKDEEKNRLIEELLGKKAKDSDYVRGMEIIIEYITKYNDDETENYDLIHDIFELTSCYEIIYHSEEDEIVYSRLDPLQTVATWDYNIPPNLTGLIRVWEENDLNGSTVKKCEITDKLGSRKFKVSENYAEVIETRDNANWGDVPAIAVETDYAIFEKCEDVISAYEQLIQNIRNTYQYNDSDCKLKISNYQPQNPMTKLDDDGNVIVNDARIQEDNQWIKSRTIYVGEGGDVTWLSKPVDANGVQIILKTYIDLMFQLAGIPNTSDLAFNSADLNASAIDRKFYIMNMTTEDAVSKLKKAYLRRWELIFNRINLKNKTNKFDFRDIDIELPKNLPANDVELIDQMLKLKGQISDQTITEKLGYNYLSEKEKMDDEAESNIIQNIERMQMLQNTDVTSQLLSEEEELENESLQ